ncbi:MAG: hypothetical protein ACXW3T_11890, partial [Rhodoplanes sp.]
ALATVATLGARTMRLAPEKAPDGAMAVVVVRNKRTGAAVRYTVADTWIPKLAEWNRTLEPRARYDEVMKADNLFEVDGGKLKSLFRCGEPSDATLEQVLRKLNP